MIHHNRRLDAHIAKSMFGYKMLRFASDSVTGIHPKTLVRKEIPKYSSNISCAIQILNYIENIDNINYSINIIYNPLAKKWECLLCDFCRCSRADTLTMAITKAAIAYLNKLNMLMDTR